MKENTKDVAADWCKIYEDINNEYRFNKSSIKRETDKLFPNDFKSRRRYTKEELLAIAAMIRHG
jgi:hypothetical protein